jgi:hypothetical protein
MITPSFSTKYLFGIIGFISRAYNKPVKYYTISSRFLSIPYGKKESCQRLKNKWFEMHPTHQKCTPP